MNRLCRNLNQLHMSTKRGRSSSPEHRFQRNYPAGGHETDMSEFFEANLAGGAVRYNSVPYAEEVRSNPLVSSSVASHLLSFLQSKDWAQLDASSCQSILFDTQSKHAFSHMLVHLNARFMLPLDERIHVDTFLSYYLIFLHNELGTTESIPVANFIMPFFINAVHNLAHKMTWGDFTDHYGVEHLAMIRQSFKYCTAATSV